MINIKNGLQRFREDKSGSLLPITALLLVIIIGTAGVAVDYSIQVSTRSKLQEVVDSAVLAGASNTGTQEERIETAETFFTNNVAALTTYSSDKASATFNFTDNNTLLGNANIDVPLFLSSVLVDGPLQVGVVSEAGVVEGNIAPCIIVLADVSDAVVFNDGGNITGPDCVFDVHSEQDRAINLNNNVNLNIEKLCIASNNILNNGGFAPSLETGCEVQPDPFAGVLEEPTIPNRCDTQFLIERRDVTLEPGLHCQVTLQGTSNLTFEPGLHIIQGTMIWEPGINVVAEGVTFYFPDTSSEIRSNGGHTLVASAPVSGDYQGVLMFEKTSDPINNQQKRQFIIADNANEALDGLIYLPNRDAVYNSDTSLEVSNFTLVVNKLILNPSSWNIAPSDIELKGGGQKAYLLR